VRISNVAHSLGVISTARIGDDNRAEILPNSIPSRPQESDEDLIARLCRGDKEALGCLFYRHSCLIRAVAYKVLRDSTEADDLLQDLFVLIYRDCRTFDRSKAPVRFWLLQMTHRRAISRRRYLTSRHFYTRVDLDDSAIEITASDESAHYEYLCKRAGITVHYCAEQFENDNSTTSNLLKALKRTMASEFSRELSVKLSTGMRRLASMGYWQGGYAPFGLVRQLIAANGEPKQILKDGEWHGVTTDRTVLVPGHPREVKTVKLAFDLYTQEHRSRRQIVDILNQRSIPPRSGKPWTMARLSRLLRADVYKGAYAYGKYVQRKLVPRGKWSICARAFQGIVSEEQWEDANARIRKEMVPYIDSEMLASLRQLWRRKGKLTERIINAARNLPSAVAYQRHFGSLNEAYKLIGYRLPREYTYVHAITMTRRMRDKLRDEICDQIRTTGATAERRLGPGMVLVNGAITVQVTFATGHSRTTPYTEWVLDLKKPLHADILVVALLCPPSQSILDYYVLPAFSGFHGRIRVRGELNAPCFDLYHFPDLNRLVASFRPCSIWRIYETDAAKLA
jgi:DNA-directed RNA polymerase specialized sigma24 family protein